MQTLFESKVYYPSSVPFLHTLNFSSFPLCHYIFFYSSVPLLHAFNFSLSPSVPHFIFILSCFLSYMPLFLSSPSPIFRCISFSILFFSVCLSVFFSISIFCSVLLFSYFPLVTPFFCLSRFCPNISVPSLLSKKSLAFPLLLILFLSLLLILFLINLHLHLAFAFSLSLSPF